MSEPGQPGEPAAVALPFQHFVVKMHSRCNLACTYCYVYEYADQSWRTRPKTPVNETIDATVARIAEHAATHNLERVRVVLHGGEPLLGKGLDRTHRPHAACRSATFDGA